MTITVFLADDHAMFREGLRFLLESQGNIQVIGEAGNGRETLKGIAKLIPDILLIDITMPDLNGIEATQQLCETKLETQVIILSMWSTSEHIYRSIEAGASGYLLKESAGVEVVKAIEAVHNGRRYFSEGIRDMAMDLDKQLNKLATSRSPLTRLSTREREILQLVVEGQSSIQIGQALALSPKTVATYRSRLMRKLDVHNIPDLVKFAIQHGITLL